MQFPFRIWCNWYEIYRHGSMCIFQTSDSKYRPREQQNKENKTVSDY